MTEGVTCLNVKELQQSLAEIEDYHSRPSMKEKPPFEYFRSFEVSSTPKNKEAYQKL